jgi:protein tyrosine phosphatase (PTP) superfamily phosphohydrolase (DUF442 family)
MSSRPAVTLALALTFVSALAAAEDRQGSATTVTANVPIKRFARVDVRLYRGGQPEPSDFSRLRDVGIRTIVSLRTDDDEREIVESLGMNFVHIPITLRPFGLAGGVSTSDIQRFLRIVDDPSSEVVFVHCRRGADRTGVFIGAYRIVRQQWSPEDAYEEAREIGMRWWYFPVRTLLGNIGPLTRLSE